MGNAGRHVAWKRFWIPRDAVPNLSGDYFADPEAEFHGDNLGLNPHAKTLDELDDKGCLVLLGEPGIGKSYVIDEYAKAVKARDGSNRLLFVDFRWDHEPIERFIFGRSSFTQFLQNAETFTLILDSLDEHPAGPTQIAAQLVREFKNLPDACLQRLRLRIGCRTVEWPAMLEEQLHHLWVKDTAPYALAPLREVDVALAVGIDKDDFLAAVARVNAQPLAAKPITLFFLLDEFEDKQRLPERQTDLYERGCLKLCEEQSSSHVDANRTGNLSPDERIAIASRIAAVTILSRRNRISFRPKRAQLLDDVAAIDDLIGGHEPTSHSTIAVTAETLREAVQSNGLFRPQDNGLLGWAHQSFAEFLAARFLIRRGLKTSQILDELSNGKMQCPVPALRVTIAWAANMDPMMRRHVLRHAPEVLLSSDLGIVSDELRDALVKVLLEKIDKEELRADELLWDRKTQLRLKASSIADQLIPYLIERNHHEHARLTAIDLAKNCRVTSLQNALADIVLDEDEPYSLRIAAGDAVAHIGDQATKRRLRRLLDQPGPVGRANPLKWIALDALWPENLTASELFASLDQQSAHDESSQCLSFILKLKQNLMAEAIPEGLKWTETQPQHYTPDGGYFSELLEPLLEQGWKFIDNASIRLAFASAVRARLKEHDRIFRDHARLGEEPPPSFADDDWRRRLLILELLQLPPWHDGAPHGAQLVHDKIVLPVDVPWILNQFEASCHSATKQRWAEVLRAFWSGGRWKFEVADAILGALSTSKALQESMPELPLVVECGSLLSRYMRREQRQGRKFCARLGKWRKKQRQRKGPRVKAARKIRSCITRFDRGDIDAGWELQKWLAYDTENRRFSSARQWDIRELSGWKLADTSVKVRVLEIAKHYLLRTHDRGSEWLEQGSIFDAVCGGYRYLCLVRELDKPWLDAHTPELWQRWASVMIAFPMSGNDDVAKDLATRAYQHNPAQVLLALDVILQIENVDFDDVPVLYRMRDCWDEQLLRFIFDFAQRPDVRPGIFGALLDRLVEKKFEDAIQFALRIVGDRLADDEETRRRQTSAMRALLAHVPEATWNQIAPILEANPRFGLELFLRLTNSAADPYRKNWGPRLEVEQIESVINWLERHIDRSAIDENAQVYTITGPRILDSLQSGLIQRLIGHGAPEALHALQRLHAAFPSRDWTFQVLTAKESVAQKTWTPRTPREIIALRQTQSIIETMTTTTSATPTVNLPKPLIDAYRAERLAVLVGSGLSYKSGLPTWQQLPGLFLDELERFGGRWTPAQIAARREIYRDPMPLHTMLHELDSLKSELGPTGYRQALAAIFRARNALPSDVHEALIELEILTLVTTNFDDLLETAANKRERRKYYTWKDAPEAIADIKDKRPVVLKIHGSAEYEKTMVMTHSEYIAATNDASYQEVMKHLLQTHTFLMLGYGMNDPLDLDALFKMNADIFKASANTHYVLVRGPEKGNLSAQELYRSNEHRWRQEFNTHAIPYEAHDQLPHILQDLRKQKLDVSSALGTPLLPAT